MGGAWRVTGEIITNGTVFLIISSLTSRQRSVSYPILSTRLDAVS